MPPMIIAAWMSIVSSAVDRLSDAAMSMGGVMLPTSIASTCCMACGKAMPNEGLPLSLYSSA